MRQLRQALTAGLCVLGLVATAGHAAKEWPGFRGPNMDGAVRDAKLFGDRAPGLSIGWKTPTGSGYSALAVSQGHVVSMFAAGEEDVVAAFKVDSGEEVWRYSIGKTYTGHDGSHDGPIATPIIADKKVYGLSAWGNLFAVDLASGKELWTVDIVDKYEAAKPHYGFSASPIMVEGVLIVEIGGPEGKAVGGFNPKNGELMWSVGDDKIEYQSPIAITMDGQRQVMAIGNTQMWGLAPRTGEVLWSYEYGGDGRAIGSASAVPVPSDDNRFLVVNSSDGAAMIQLEKTGEGVKAKELWSNNAFRGTYVTPVYHDGYLYGINGRVLACVDAATGETKWRSRQPGDGFPTLVGDYLVHVTKPGDLHIIKASPDGYEEVAMLDLFDEHVWSEVAYADGYLYARSMEHLARIDLKAAVDDAAGASGVAVRGSFAKFLKELESASDKDATIEAFMAKQSSFPIVEGVDTVHFVYRGEAEDVGIVGDVIGFRREDPMTRVAGTDLFYYTAKVEPTAAASYGFLVDYGDEPIADPKNDRAAEGLFGEISWFSMPAWDAGADFTAEAPKAKQGKLEDFEWESKAREEAEQRVAKIYLPAGYETSGERRYPVLYVHDGGSALEEGMMKNALDNLIGDRVEPLIAVFILPPEGNEQDLRDMEGYGKMLASELIPTIDGKYRTIAEAHGRASIGAGSAGSSAMGIAFNMSEMFGRAGSQSAILPTAALEGFLTNASEKPMVVYMDWGTYHLRSPHEAWDYAQHNRDNFALLREHGYRPAGGEIPEGFGWASWRAHVDEMLTALFPAGAAGS